MEGYYVKKIGNNRGAPRIWLEGSQTARAGFEPGQRYDVVVDGMTVVLQANKDGSRIVSGKKAGEKTNPVIDLNSIAMLAVFDGMAAVRVVVKQGEIHLLPLATELKKRERFKRLRDKLESGMPLNMGSISHGGGVLAHAIHKGLNDAGVNTNLSFANDIREELLEHASAHNDAWNQSTMVVSAPMQEFAFDARGLAKLPRVEGLELGLPCSGASKAGRSKRHLEHPEAHPDVGHLVVAALVIINQVNPAFVVLENVVGYSTSASADILRNQLRDMGYNTHECVLNGKQWGSLENRDRWCLVAVTDGIEFDFNQLMPPDANVRFVREVLDPNIGPDDSRWREFGYLKDKQIRDQEKGNGFGMQIVGPDDTSVPTLRKGYHKGGSTDPLVQHPSDPDLLRQFTSKEHADIKGVPSSLVTGLSETIAHQILGQGIVYTPFRAVGKHLGEALTGKAAEVPSVPLEAVKVGKMIGLRVQAPNSESGRYSGQVVAVTAGHVIQDAGRGEAVAHPNAALESPAKLGKTVTVKYESGKGKIHEKPAKQLSLGLS